jgi:peptidoglycan/LPS O-acetylase OafA/YrhL
MKYRKDIQILRGISILLVVLFHLGVSGFEKGFLGVDIFFVISGFLMAGLCESTQTRDFYLKRAKRILPAYFVVILCTLVVCLALTTPNDFDQVITQSLFAIAFSSNIGYWFENSYFDKAAFKPLLHLWSLGVEIQFYLLVPVLHKFITKYKGGYFTLLVASLAACFVVVGISPKTSFFMMPLRLWEFLIGYGVATYMSKHPQGENSVLRWIGAACLTVLIGIPMLGDVDGAALGWVRGHPGLSALFVAMVTGTLLAVGLPTRFENLRIAGFLETVGKYSYSIYVVHFPVVVLLLYQPFSGTLLKANGIAQTFGLIALICVLSVLMYRFVEYPLRMGSRTLRWLLVAGCAVLVLIPFGLMFQNLKFSIKERAVFGAWTDRDVYRCGKLIRLLEPNSRSCEITDTVTKPKHRILLVGDSHADSVKATFKSAAEARNVSIRFLVENAPLREGGMTAEGLIHEAELRNIGTIVMHYSPGGVDPLIVKKVADLALKKNIKVSFIKSVPVWGEHLPKALYKNLTESVPIPRMTLDNYLEANRSFDEALSNIDLENFKIHQIAEIFCRPDCQVVDASWRPLYFDSSHLTLTGSELLRPVFVAITENGS